MKLPVLFPLALASTVFAQGHVCRLDGNTYDPNSKLCKDAGKNLLRDRINGGSGANVARTIARCCDEAKNAAKATPTPTIPTCPTNFVGPIQGDCTPAPTPTGYRFPSHAYDAYGWWSACAHSCNSGKMEMLIFCDHAPWFIKPLGAQENCYKVIDTIGSLWGGNVKCYEHCEKYWPQKG